MFKKFPELVEILNLHRNCFESFLKNEPRSTADRLTIKNSTKEPISVEGIPQRITLSTDFIQEALIISDLFDLNEFIAVDLLLSGEAESTSNTDSNRGLCAVLGYYKSQKIFVECFKVLLQAKYFVMENNAESLEVLQFIDDYLNSLFDNDNLLSTLINIVKSMDIDKDIIKLENQRALGSGKHRRQFYTIYGDIRNLISECIMIRANSVVLSQSDINKIICLVQDVYTGPENEKSSNKSDVAKPDVSFLNLLTSCFCSFSPKWDKSSGLSDTDIDYDKSLVDEQHQRDLGMKLKSNIDNANQTLIDQFDKLIYFNWVINLQKWSQLKQNQPNDLNTSVQQHRVTSNYGDIEDYAELECGNLNVELICSCLEFINQLVLIPEFHKNITLLKCFHDFITNFIILMPRLLKDLHRKRSEYFAMLLEFIGSFYSGNRNHNCNYDINVFDDNNDEDVSGDSEYKQLIESMVCEYWSHHELKSSSDAFTLQIMDNNIQIWFDDNHDTYRNSALFKFIRDSGDLVQDEHIYISYVYMLKGMCCSEKMALYIYCLLNNNTIRNQSNRLTWEWFSECLHRHAEFWTHNLHNHVIPTISSQEIDGLVIVLQLIERVCKMNSIVRSTLLHNESLRLPLNIIILLTCQLPECVKAELINCLAAFACNNIENTLTIWRYLESSCIITNDNQCTMLMELDEVEPRQEEYSMTHAFINLLYAVTPSIISSSLAKQQQQYHQQSTGYQDQQRIMMLHNSVSFSLRNNYHEIDVLSNMMQILIDAVFLKLNVRTYHKKHDKYVICNSFLQLSITCVELFLARLISVSTSKGHLNWCQYDPGFLIVSQLITDSPFFNTLMNIIDQGHQLLDDNNCHNLHNYNVNRLDSSDNHLFIKSLKSTVSNALKLIWSVLNNENVLIPLMRELMSAQKTRRDVMDCGGRRVFHNRTFVVEEISKLIISSTNFNYNILISLLKYISMVDECEGIARKSLAIFNSCIKAVQPHSNLILMLTNKSKSGLDVMSILLNCIDKYGIIDDIVFARSIESNDRGIDIYYTNILSKLLFKHGQHYPPHNDILQSPRTIVLELLINCLQKPTPNFGQYLMGYNCSSSTNVSKTCLQDAGIGDFPKTCLHSLINLVTSLVEQLSTNPCLDKHNNVTLYHHTSLIVNMIDLTLIYRIFFLLANNTHTGSSFLRFVRTNYKLLDNQLEVLALSAENLSHIPEAQALLWNQKSWLLQLLAIEIRCCSTNQQRSYVANLLTTLFGDDLYSNKNSFITNNIYDNASNSSSGMIFQLLEDLDLNAREDMIDFSSCRRFKKDVLKEYLNQCGQQSYLNTTIMNPTKLHQIILADINFSLEESNQEMMEDINDICNHLLLRYNRNTMMHHGGKIPALESLRQLIELVMLLLMNKSQEFEMITNEMKYHKLTQILQFLLKYYMSSSSSSSSSSCSSSSNILSIISRTCLILSSILGTLFLPTDLDNINNTSQLSPFIMGQDDKRMFVDNKLINSINYDEFQSNIKQLIYTTVDCIVNTNNIQQNTRIKLYGSLIFMLQIVIKYESYHHNKLSHDVVNEIFYMINHSNDTKDCINTDLSLYSTVSRDCVSGNIHLSLSAISLLNCLLSIDKGCGHLISFITSHGYLQHMITNLTKDCTEISLAIRSNDGMCNSAEVMENCPGYYNCQSRLALMCKLSTYSTGAKALVHVGLLSSLAKCELFKLRTSITDTDTYHAATKRPFSHLICTCVQLATNILVSYGADKSESIKEVMIFITEFIDTLTAPFTNQNSLMSNELIQELINISNLFTLTLPVVIRTPTLYEMNSNRDIIEHIRICSSQTITYLLMLLNDSSCLFNVSYNIDNDSNENIQPTMLHLLNIQLFTNLVNIAAGYVISASSTSNVSSSDYFSYNIEGIQHINNNNWTSMLRKCLHLIQTGNKPPLTMLIMIVLKSMNLFEQIQQRISKFHELLPNSADRTKQSNNYQLDELFDTLSLDQLRGLWASIFDNYTTNASTTNEMVSMDWSLSTGAGHSRSLLSINRSRLVKDLMIIYEKLISVHQQLIDSMEASCYLVWQHCMSAKKNQQEKQNLINNNNNFNTIHPMLRLKDCQMEKKKKQQLAENSNNQEDSVIGALAKCLHSDVLDKMKDYLHIDANNTAGDSSDLNHHNPNALSKVIVHRLTKLFNLIN